MNELIPSQRMVALPTMRVQTESGVGKSRVPTGTVEYVLTPGATKSTWMHVSISVIEQYTFGPLRIQQKPNKDSPIKTRLKLVRRQLAKYMTFVLYS